MTPKKGFTLIELLVVIAIIGILASIVLVSLSGARNKAKDARITSDMNQIRTTAMIVSDTDGDYDCVCLVATPACATCNPDIVTLAADANVQNGAAAAAVINPNLASGATAYCAEIQMNTGWWCVDSTLRSQFYAADPICAAAVYTCQ